MFAFLSKKIAIPGDAKLRTIAWCASSGWIACGGDNALLKVFRLDGAGSQEPPAADAGQQSSGSSKALSLNQALEGHSGAVVCAAWNHVHNKLTSSDESGLIIVWTLHDGTWFEEMINNRNKGVPTDMRWSADGGKICIAYDDGAVIVGGVDGARLWGKDLGLQLCLLQWAPDGAHLLFATAAGECHTYDSSGNGVAKMQLYCNEGYAGAYRVVAVEWYDGGRGFCEPGCPVLAVCLDNGRMQLMRLDLDDNAICIETGIKPSSCKWNAYGSVLAVSGHQTAPDGRQLWLVQFYSCQGEHLRTMRVPGGGISGIAWEGSGLRLALAVDGSVYFASVRQAHPWACFAGTLVYAYTAAERSEHCIMFWATHSNERSIKYVKRLTRVCAAGDLCMLVAKGEAADEHLLILCNAIGSPVDSKVIETEPKFVCLTDDCAVAASDDVVHVWQFRISYTRQLAGEQARVAAAAAAAAAAGGSAASSGASTGPGSSAASKLQRAGREKLVHIDSPNSAQAPDQFKLAQHGSSSDPICAITAHKQLLLVARGSGLVQAFVLPGLTAEWQCAVRSRPARLLLNCDASRLAVVDFAGVLSVLDLAAPASGGLRGAPLGIERKDVWDVCWASDDPEALAVMEKGRLVVLRGSEADEPISSSAWLAGFADLQVHAVALDDIMQCPGAPELSMVVEHETRSLRDTRALLAAGKDAEAQAFIADNAHPRLWRLLAEHALQRLDLPTAEKGFVQCRDYQGVQLVKRIAALPDRQKQQAEVHVYFKRFDEAEALYRALDRPDLALSLRSRLGDWFSVETLVVEAGGDDAALAQAWGRIGGYYSDRQKWAKAAQYYTKARKTAMLVECCYQLEDFAALAQLTEVLTEGQPLLADIGRRLQGVGLCKEAVAAFTKFGDMRAAIDCCVQLHQWDQALELAHACGFTSGAEGLLQQCAAHLLGKRRYLEAVELYRKAQCHAKAAKLLVDTAEQLAGRRAPPLQLKKLYVLAALETEAHSSRKLLQAGAAGAGAREGKAARGSVLTGAAGGAATRTAGAAQTLAGLMSLEAEGSAGAQQLKGVHASNAWRGAEAYHFWLLAHRQLYGGQVDAALRSALQLRRYLDILPPLDVWSLLGLVGFYAGFFGTCSKAFVRLESLPSLSRERREAYADLAMAIFQQHPPADPCSIAEARDVASGSSSSAVSNKAAAGGAVDVAAHKDQVCVASGRAIREEPKQRCSTCRHLMITAELAGQAVCPLCHSKLKAAAAATPKQQPAGGSNASGSRPATSSSSFSMSTSSSAKGGKHVRMQE